MAKSAQDRAIGRGARRDSVVLRPIGFDDGACVPPLPWRFRAEALVESREVAQPTTFWGRSSCAFSRAMTLLWIWQTRDSVSSMISPISRIVSPS